MKTNKIMDEIRRTISPEMKRQIELSMAMDNRIDESLDENNKAITLRK